MDRKNVLKALRISTRADNLIEKLVDVCNKYDLTLNGSQEINTSLLFSQLFEEVAHSQIKQEKLQVILSLYQFKHHGEPIDPDLIKIIIKEVLK